MEKTDFFNSPQGDVFIYFTALIFLIFIGKHECYKVPHEGAHRVIGTKADKDNSEKTDIKIASYIKYYKFYYFCTPISRSVNRVAR